LENFQKFSGKFPKKYFSGKTTSLVRTNPNPNANPIPNMRTVKRTFIYTTMLTMPLTAVS